MPLASIDADAALQHHDELDALIDSRAERRRIGDAARRASEAYSWDAVSLAAEQAYLQTIHEYADGRGEGIP